MHAASGLSAQRVHRVIESVGRVFEVTCSSGYVAVRVSSRVTAVCYC